MNTDITKDLDLDEFEDFEANEEVVYLVCALGYGEHDEATDCEIYLGEFDDPAEAVAFANTVTLETILQHGVEQVQKIASTAYFNLEVETVVAYEDCSENIDTIWETKISIC